MTDLSKAYRTDVVLTSALRDFSIGVRQREFVAVTGPSGSGKSTFVTIAGLLANFSGGEYKLMARGVLDLLEELHHEGATIVMVTHDPALAVRAQPLVHIVDGKVVELTARRATPDVGT